MKKTLSKENVDRVYLSFAIITLNFGLSKFTIQSIEKLLSLATVCKSIPILQKAFSQECKHPAQPSLHLSAIAPVKEIIGILRTNFQ
ncbi:hypothetical protein QUA80_23865 [Microcoleus sp. F4-D5]